MCVIYLTMMKGETMIKIIDLRSDTVTKPTEEMKKSSYDAMLGDDVYSDDPTVNELEEYSAKLLGKEDGLFVPSGTFGNQVCIMTHTKRADEIIVADNSHILIDEVGASGVISGVQLRTFTLENGNRLPFKQIDNLYREDDIHFPETGLICLENAVSSGRLIPLEDMKKLKKWANEKNIPIHLDGARLFNAAIALNVSAKEIAEQVDSINVCLSKGLAAPIGSVVVGNREFIKKARKNRKLLGGGMRQVGVIAAPALYALKNMISRLQDDHDNAKYMANRLSEIPEINIDINAVEINMVFFSINLKNISEQMLVENFKKKNILINGSEDGKFRFVTHNDIDKKDIDTMIEVFKKILN